MRYTTENAVEPVGGFNGVKKTNAGSVSKFNSSQFPPLFQSCRICGDLIHLLKANHDVCPECRDLMLIGSPSILKLEAA